MQPNGRIVWVLTQVVREVDGRGADDRLLRDEHGHHASCTMIREELQHSHAALEVRMRDRDEELQRMALIVALSDDAMISTDPGGANR